MIRLIRKRFILMISVSFFIALSLIILSINHFNYVTYVNEADDLLVAIAENKGEIPEKKNKFNNKKEDALPPDKEKHDDKIRENVFDGVYEICFFSVLYNTEGENVYVNTQYSPYVDKNTAVQFAEEVRPGNKKFDHYGDYRYYVKQSQQGTAIIFLDRAEELSKVRQFLVISVAMSVIGYLAVFIIICIISKRVIKPFVENQIKQKQFIADAGHEIKTPVTIIKADAEVLMMDMEENEWLEDIIRQTERLGRLTDDLVFLSKTDGVPILAMGDVDLSLLATETGEEFKAIAKARGISFEQEIQQGVIVKGDKRSMKRLLSVILDNAVKYSPSGEKINTCLKIQFSKAVIEVENTAPDMNVKEMSVIFDRFYRGDKSRGGDVKGYGLGLAMAKAIVESHKGKIVASLNKQRFKITVNLPIN